MWNAGAAAATAGAGAAPNAEPTRLVIEAKAADTKSRATPGDSAPGAGHPGYPTYAVWK